MTVERLEGMAAETGRPVFMTAALHNETFPDRAIGMLDDAAAAQSRGNAVWAQVSCQPLRMDFSMRTAFPLQSLDAWEPLHGASDDDFLAIIASEDFRNRFREDLEKPQQGKIFYGDWRRVEVAMAATPAHRPAGGRDHRGHRRARGSRSGRRDVRPRRGREAGHHLQRRPCSTPTRRRWRTCCATTPASSACRTPAPISATCATPATACTCWATGCATRACSTWPTAFRRITSLPAQLYGIADRGEIAPGMFADLMLFDPATVGRGAIRRVDDLPGGESRLIREASGVHGVWVNGTGVYDEDGYRDVPPPGHVLDRFRR